MPFVADFETITDPADCRVWAWALCDIDNPDDILMGIDINTFLNRVYTLGKDSVYFHNLGYDGRFIIDALIRRGWQHCQNAKDYELKSGQFTTLISAMGKFYQITIKTRDGWITFKDSLKLLPMSVERVARAYQLPDNEQKGMIDYEAYREPGHRLTEDEKTYIRNDVLIIARALKIQFDQGLTRLTAGSNAFHSFHRLFGASRWENYFPVLSGDIDADIRRAYRGGYTYCNPDYRGVDIGAGISCDYNSMYPSVMMMYPFPVGFPKLFSGQYKYDPKMPLFVQRLTCMFKVKPGKLPMIQITGSWDYARHEYVTETLEPVHLTLSSVDLELFLDNYDVDIFSYNGGYAFHSARGLFDPYIDVWRKEKEQTTGGRREIAKLMLNSLYGKFGTNPDVTQKIPEMHDDIVRYVLGVQELRDPVYIPVAVYVTAYARRELITAIQENWDRFVYCDTDSMHLLGLEPPTGIKLDNVEFGHWKIEGDFTRARHLRSKCYIWDLRELQDERPRRLSVTCAGMPGNIKDMCTWDNFHIGFSNLDSQGKILPGRGKLVPKSVPGGVVLESRPYQLR